MFSNFRLFCCLSRPDAKRERPPPYQPPRRPISRPPPYQPPRRPISRLAALSAARRPISRPAALSALNLWLHNILKDNNYILPHKQFHNTLRLFLWVPISFWSEWCRI